jgi:hypothetical protein
MPEQSVCAQIGVHEGEFSRRILDLVASRRLHLIDPWKHMEGYSGSLFGGMGADGQRHLDERNERVKESLTAEIAEGQVQIHRAFSALASETFDDSYFDWIYIDGNHTCEFVGQDLELYYPKVKAGGFMIGDDYGVKGWWNNEDEARHESGSPAHTVRYQGSVARRDRKRNTGAGTGATLQHLHLLAGIASLRWIAPSLCAAPVEPATYRRRCLAGRSSLVRTVCVCPNTRIYQAMSAFIAVPPRTYRKVLACLTGRRRAVVSMDVLKTPPGDGQKHVRLVVLADTTAYLRWSGGLRVGGGRKAL